MSKTILLAILFFSWQFSGTEDNCFVLPVEENQSNRTFYWGDKMIVPDIGIPIGVYDHMVFAIPKGTVVNSYSDGIVLSTNYDSSKFGKTISIQHDSNVISFYGHLDTSFVVVGQKVKCGENIGISGFSGRTAGPNLYFKVTHDGISINPMDKM